MDKAKFFKMQLNSEIVLCEMDAERMAETIRRLSAGATRQTGPTMWPLPLFRWPRQLEGSLHCGRLCTMPKF